MSYTPNVDEEFEKAVRGNGTPPNPIFKPISQGISSRELDRDVLKLFTPPEYVANHQPTLISEGKSKRTIEPTSFQHSQGTVSNINTQELKKKKRRKLTPFSKKAIIITVVGILSILITAKEIGNKPEPIVIPDGYVQIYANEEVNYGESVYSIASEYYNPQTYGTMYEDLNQFVDVIIDTNNLSFDGKITTYDTLSIPVLVDVDNPYFQELRALEAQIKKIKEETYWVDYTVKYGDSLSTIAAQASGSYGETISLVNEIMSKNALPNSLIYAGQEIKIVNQDLGPLKVRFNEVQSALYESLKTDNNQKTH